MPTRGCAPEANLPHILPMRYRRIDLFQDFGHRELEESGGYLNLDLPPIPSTWGFPLFMMLATEDWTQGWGLNSPSTRPSSSDMLIVTAVATLSAGAPPATSGRFCRKWALILPWVLDFWAVFRGRCSLSASPTWGNVGAVRRFGLIQPAKPPRSLQAISVIELGLLLRLAPINLRRLLPFDSQGLGAR